MLVDCRPLERSLAFILCVGEWDLPLFFCVTLIGALARTSPHIKYNRHKHAGAETGRKRARIAFKPSVLDQRGTWMIQDGSSSVKHP